MQSLAIVAMFGALSMSSCKKENAKDDDQTGEQTPAVLYVEQFQSPNDIIVYMGAYANVPTSTPDRSKMVELGPNHEVTTYRGFVYDYDGNSSVINQYKVENNLAMKKASSVSFAATGVTALYTNVFVSATSAFVFNIAAGKIVEWNPTAMTITKTYNVTPCDPNGSVAYPRLSGTKIVMSVQITDYKTNKADPKCTAAIFDLTAKTLNYVTDTRVPSYFDTYADSQGNVYFMPVADDHFLILLNPSQPAASLAGGVIRIKAGASTFDPDFYINLKTVTGSEFVAQSFPISDTKWLVESIEKTPAGTTVDNFFTRKMVKEKYVDINNKTVTSVGGLTDTYAMCYPTYRKWKVDSDNYFLLTSLPNGDATQVNSSVGIINDAGFNAKFTTSNSWINELKRIR